MFIIINLKGLVRDVTSLPMARALCDGWRKMLVKNSILRQPSQSGPREYYATTWYQSWPGLTPGIRPYARCHA
eukprot:COSAG02_NODE_34056_length_490_cov_0.910486_2_plen_72_part_01